LRGIGALIVVVGHCLLTNTTLPPWMYHFPLTLVSDGDGIVLLFFALSGFVLFAPFRAAQTPAYLPYLVKRFVRIYPPFVVAVLCSALLYLLVQPHPIAALSPWFNGSSWQVPPSLGIIVGHFALTDARSLQGFDNVMWSLTQEMRMSLIFPLIALFVIGNWRVAVAASFIIAIRCNQIDASANLDWTWDPFLTLSYLFLFTGGAALALNRDRLAPFFARLPRWTHIALWIVAIRLVAVPAEVHAAIITNIGALAIVALAVGTNVADGFLSFGAFRWLGRVSYSLYLVHLPIILTYVHLFHGRAPLPLLLLASIATALPSAELMHRWVERPAVDCAQRLATALAQPRRRHFPVRLVAGLETPT
jgi:peptidoglycan/LPS O-acetylase OafA/YrhL